MDRNDTGILTEDLFSEMLAEEDAQPYRFPGAEKLLMKRMQEMHIISEDQAGICAYEADPWQIRLLYVRNGYRSQGIGHRLVEAVRQEAQQACAARITAEVTPSQKNFYEKEGFLKRAEGQTDTYEYLLGKELLGRTVTAEIEHALGSYHPGIPDLAYPLNAGYILYNGGVIDAYAVTDEPCDAFTGIVCAVLWRRNSDGIRVILARAGEMTDKDRVLSLIGILEQGDDVYIEWAV
ncbi:MAG: GNAT family N-acetyltransferase [Solobacterium sp.]|nr:GNAT family N-acetyltransferase [Solobacterium sp.]